MKFTKMHGIGNDFVMVNGFKESGHDWPDTSRAVCDRRFGIGSDGLIVAFPGEREQFSMRMWNPDGSESEMCGNGVRCFAMFLHQEGLTNETSIPVETGAGRLCLDIMGDQVRVDMGPARLTRGEIGVTGVPGSKMINEPLTLELGESPSVELLGTAVSMGNPHIVFFWEDVDAVPLEKYGPLIERHELFPNRINAHFVQVLSPTEIKMRTWERGAGVTLACGTGACACGVASFMNGKTDRTVHVHLPGGSLHIDYLATGRVNMTGPAVTVFEGNWAAT